MAQKLGAAEAYVTGNDETVWVRLDTGKRWIYASRLTRYTVYLRVEFTVDAGHHKIRYHVSTDASMSESPPHEEIQDSMHHCAGFRPIITGLSGVRSRAVVAFS